MSDFQNIERLKLVECSKNVSLLWKKLKQLAQPKRSNTYSITANEWVTHLSKLLCNENAHSDAVDYNNNESDEF